MRRRFASKDNSCIATATAVCIALGVAVLQTQTNDAASQESSHQTNDAASQESSHQTNDAASQESSQQHQPIFVPSTDNILTFSLNRLGGEQVTIWNDSRQDQRYYFSPSLIPDWEKFSRDIDEECAIHTEARIVQDAINTVRLHVDLSDAYYEAEIRTQLTALRGDARVLEGGDARVLEDVLNALPHDNIQILLRRNSALPSRLLYDARNRSRLTGDETEQSPPLVRYPRDIAVPIVGNCEELSNLADLALDGEELLSGKIYFFGIRYQTTAFWADMNTFLDSERSLDLFGDESFVTRTSFTNTTAQAGVAGSPLDGLHINLSGAQHSGSRVSSGQRILSRDYLDHVKSTSFASIAGGCVEASFHAERCTELQNLFMNFLLRHAREIELTFRRLENGSFELTSGQETYATLTSTEYQTIAESGPTQNTSDNITWRFGESGPVPTSVTLFVLDRQSLRSRMDVEWYNRVPVEGSFQQLVVPLDYFSRRIADGRILATEDYMRRAQLNESCQAGGQIVLVTKEQISTKRRRDIQNARIILHRDESTRCRIKFGGVWRARDDHFFLLPADRNPVSVVDNWTKRERWGFDSSVGGHELDVPRRDGRHQIVSVVSYSGRAGRNWNARRKTCGARVRLNLQQYPNACAPFLVNGFWERHSTLEASDFE